MSTKTQITLGGNMSLVSNKDLHLLVEGGVISADSANINGASIDITIGDIVLVEETSEPMGYIDLQAKQSPKMIPFNLSKSGFPLFPGQFILATSKETFNLPNNIAAEYKLKSSLARSGLQHLMAGWCDPGWNNSKLTLELKNVTQNNVLIIKPGMKIGQMVFWACEPVPDEESYAAKGQYNDQDTVTENKGLR